MAGKGKIIKRGNVYDWEALEIEFLELPSVSVSEFGDMKGIPYSTLREHADPGAGAWLEKRKERFMRIQDENRKRLADILHESKRDDLSAFKALEDRLKCVVLSSLELIFPPDDAPMEAHIAARNRLEAMSAKQLSGIINEGLRTLTETGRHRRLLTGQSTAIFSRAELPDVMIPLPMEEARALEMRSRMAQTALNAIAEGQPLDVDFAVMDESEEAPAYAHAEARTIPPDFADV